MSTGRHVPTAAESFESIASDPMALRSFLACIGSSTAPSRVRAAELVAAALCESVVDVGCGPAVLFDTLRECEAVGPFRYVGVDPVEELLHIAQGRIAATVLLDVSRENVDGADGGHLLVLDDPLAYLARHRKGCGVAACPSRFDAAIVRHVIEHLPDPLPLLEAAAGAATRLVVVVVSQETRAAGLPRPVLTDAHLGAMRWSHWRRDITATMERLGWTLKTHEQGPPLVVREELFAWVRA